MGLPKLRLAIADYYNHFYNSRIDHENVMIFAGGRPALVSILMFLKKDIQINIASTEYTPYYDMLKIFNRRYHVVNSNEDNNFRPSNEDYQNKDLLPKSLVLLSNPCNPTGITKRDDELKNLVEDASFDDSGLLIDEAYELFHSPPVSAMRFIKDINNSNFFLAGAATKGLQAPGIRIGWVVSSKRNIEILGNFSSIGMGGVSRFHSYIFKIIDPKRVETARSAVPSFYSKQRVRYKTLLMI